MKRSLKYLIIAWQPFALAILGSGISVDVYGLYGLNWFERDKAGPLLNFIGFMTTMNLAELPVTLVLSYAILKKRVGQ